MAVPEDRGRHSRTVMLGYLLVLYLFSNTGSAFFWIDALIDVSFILDVVFNFRGATRYTDAQTGLLETDWRKVAKNYAQTWFVVDLVACLPVG
eukprot:COSAG02_NODE_1863_length_10608_cov_128.518508_1_plen_92_part_10